MCLNSPYPHAVILFYYIWCEMLCVHKNTRLINGAVEGVSLLQHHVVSRPYDLSTVVTCQLVSHTVLEDAALYRLFCKDVPC
jgi:hypothetical protein